MTFRTLNKRIACLEAVSVQVAVIFFADPGESEEDTLRRYGVTELPPVSYWFNFFGSVPPVCEDKKMSALSRRVEKIERRNDDLEYSHAETLRRALKLEEQYSAEDAADPEGAAARKEQRDAELSAWVDDYLRSRGHTPPERAAVAAPATVEELII